MERGSERRPARGRRDARTGLVARRGRGRRGAVRRGLPAGTAAIDEDPERYPPPRPRPRPATATDERTTPVRVSRGTVASVPRRVSRYRLADRAAAVAGPAAALRWKAVDSVGSAPPAFVPRETVGREGAVGRGATTGGGREPPTLRTRVGDAGPWRWSDVGRRRAEAPREGRGVRRDLRRVRRHGRPAGSAGDGPRSSDCADRPPPPARVGDRFAATSRMRTREDRSNNGAGRTRGGAGRTRGTVDRDRSVVRRRRSGETRCSDPGRRAGSPGPGQRASAGRRDRGVACPVLSADHGAAASVVCRVARGEARRPRPRAAGGDGCGLPARGEARGLRGPAS